MGSSTIFCIECGAANPLHAKFCFACGQAITTDGRVASEVGEIGKLRTGEVLKQRYVIQSQIGQGGFGAVYKAEDTALGNRPVAVKEMSHQQKHGQTDGEDSVEAFKREALMLAGLKHEHMPHIYEYFSENECWD